MVAKFRVDAEDGGAQLMNFAKGGAYYGLWYVIRTAEANGKISATCLPRLNICETILQPSGSKRNQNGPVQVYTDTGFQNPAVNASLNVDMHAALEASGGPEVQVAPRGIGTTIRFPRASFHFSEMMGYYRWHCE